MLCIANKRAAALSPRNWELIIYSDSKAIRLAFSKKLKSSFLSVFFPSEYDSAGSRNIAGLNGAGCRGLRSNPEMRAWGAGGHLLPVWRDDRNLGKEKAG